MQTVSFPLNVITSRSDIHWYPSASDSIQKSELMGYQNVKVDNY